MYKVTSPRMSLHTYKEKQTGVLSFSEMAAYSYFWSNTSNMRASQVAHSAAGG